MAQLSLNKNERIEITILSNLLSNEDFTRKAFSVTSNNQIIELYTNKYKGNWLIIVTGTDKITCGLIVGQQEFIFE